MNRVLNLSRGSNLKIRPQNLCIENLRIKPWSSSSAYLQIYLIALWYPVLAIPSRNYTYLSSNLRVTTYNIDIKLSILTVRHTKVKISNFKKVESCSCKVLPTKKLKKRPVRTLYFNNNGARWYSSFDSSRTFVTTWKNQKQFNLHSVTFKEFRRTFRVTLYISSNVKYYFYSRQRNTSCWFKKKIGGGVICKKETVSVIYSDPIMQR